MKNILRRKQATRAQRTKQKGERSMLRLQIIVGVLITLSLSALFAAVYYVSHIPRLQITGVEVHGGYTISHNIIKDRAEQELQGKYFRFIPHRFAWLYPKHTITQRLGEIPRLKQSALSLNGQTLTIVFDEYQPAALWCDSEGTHECYFVDHTGFAFSKAPELSGSAFIRYSEHGASGAVKTQVIDHDFLKASQEFADQLARELDLYVTHIMIEDALDVTYTVSGGGLIKTSRRMALPDIFANLKSILSSEDFAHLETGSFAYIDLRFGDKVFVNEVGDVPETETASSSEEAGE